MIGTLSPLSRRIIALGILVLALLLALTAIETMTAAVGDALARLEQARSRSARLEALRDRPSPPEPTPLPEGMALRAPGHAAAAELAQARIATAASSAEIVPSQIEPAPQDSSNPGLVRVAVVVEGAESRILDFVERLERDPPAIRLRAWRIGRLEGEASGLRLDAVAVAAWEAPR
ncbi:hypothetical protein [Sphingosinicella terrae]|uniref:hypothetical protein n=1 Tax=Sphingosinicella terrae TaxID=2172047 RepID=UPI0013B3D778|nr:hypothetical protein [Sphingosinicella terrae]